MCILSILSNASSLIPWIYLSFDIIKTQENNYCQSFCSFLQGQNVQNLKLN